jgi:hypothetical protein
MIRTTLAHDRITAALGAGGMGEVWRTIDTKLDHEEVLAVLPETVVERRRGVDAEARPRNRS